MSSLNGMHGMHVIKDATGDYPVYPGHPLTLAYEIIQVFPNPEAALKTVQSGNLNCPEAVADSRITGAGGEVYGACELLERARKGEPGEKLIEWADWRWTSSQAGGHVDRVEPGLAQAEKLKALFPGKLAAWLAA